MKKKFLLKIKDYSHVCVWIFLIKILYKYMILTKISNPFAQLPNLTHRDLSAYLEKDGVVFTHVFPISSTIFNPKLLLNKNMQSKWMLNKEIKYFECYSAFSLCLL